MKRIVGALLTGLCVLAAGSVPDRKPGEVLAGVLEYQGGFAELRVAVKHKDVVKSFRLAVPKFCQADVEVLEAGTVTEGEYDEAKLVSAKDNTYAVNNGAGQRISAVEATLNGPKDVSCSIPVYLNGKAAVDPEPTGNLRANVCNRSRETAWVALGYHDGTRWKATGWWKLTRRECGWLTVKGSAGHSLYLHGRTAGGSTWGSGDARFCVVNDIFTAGDEACTSGTGYWAPFSKLKAHSDGAYYLDLLN